MHLGKMYEDLTGREINVCPNKVKIKVKKENRAFCQNDVMTPRPTRLKVFQPIGCAINEISMTDL